MTDDAALNRLYQAATRRLEMGRVLELHEYRQKVAGLDRPTFDQMAAFATSRAVLRSFYKDRPYFPPRIAIYFFIDPGAGMERIYGEDWTVGLQPRVRPEGSRWLDTSVYRERFGYLSSSSGIGEVPRILAPGMSRLAPLPGEILFAGRALVSGLIHPRSAAFPRTWLAEADAGALDDWPEASGGAARAAAIVQRSRELEADPGCRTRWRPPPRAEWSPFCDPRGWGADGVLRDLIEPERERQLHGMVSAMQRVCERAWGAAPS